MSPLALGRIARLPFAGLFSVAQAATYVGLSIPVGSVIGFAAAGFYEPFAGRRIDHRKAAGYGGMLAGWFMLCFCGFLVIVPLD
jgi:hypothetical protein